MSRRTSQPALPQTSWSWPFQRKRYDRTPTLREAERDQLDLQRCAKQLSHITSSFHEQEEDTRNAETTPAHPER